MEKRILTADVMTRTCRGESFQLRYALLQETQGALTQYGVEIAAETKSGCQTARAARLTSSREKAGAFLALLARNTVTPTTLADVVQDWL